MRLLNPIRDTHPLMLTWDVFLLCVVLCSSMIVPYRLTFGYEQNDFIYWMVTSVFAFDILVRLNTSVRVGDHFLSDRKRLVNIYLRSGFVLDFLSAIPFAAFLPDSPELSHTWIGSILVPLQLLRLLKLWRFKRTLQHFQGVFFFRPAIIRLILFFFGSVLLIHLVALGWVFIGAGDQDGSEFHRYLMALYWAISTTSTIGYGDITPDRSQHIQVIYAMCIQLIGVSMLGYIAGNIASILANIDVAKANFLKKMEDVNNFSKANGIPSTIQSKVHGYYRYLWESRGTIENEPSVISDLPDSLKIEILVFLNAEMIQKVAIFKGMGDEFIRQVVQLLETQVYLPKDFIIRQGDIGDRMYFLLSGEVEVLVNGQKVAHLSSGSPFGETALIQEERRNASVQTLDYCDVYVLTKRNFDILRERFPKFDVRVKEIAEARLLDTAFKTKS